MHVVAVDLIEGEDDAQLPERLAFTPRQCESPRVRAVDDVDVVVAGHEQQSLAQLWVTPEQIEERRPLSSRSRVRDVAGDDDVIEGRLSVNRVELSQRVEHALVALWTGGAGLQAIAVALADQVQVGQVRHPPSADWRRVRAR